MFKIDEHNNMYLNRGDQVAIELTANQNFLPGDTIKFSVVKEKDYSTVLLQKIFEVTEESDIFTIELTSEDTRFCDLLKNQPKTFWYEIEYNNVSTLVGYDDEGGKQFVLWPEAPNNKNNGEIADNSVESI